jgi:HK97 family phage major capsid protein
MTDKELKDALFDINSEMSKLTERSKTTTKPEELAEITENMKSLKLKGDSIIEERRKEISNLKISTTPLTVDGETEKRAQRGKDLLDKKSVTISFADLMTRNQSRSSMLLSNPDLVLPKNMGNTLSNNGFASVSRLINAVTFLPIDKGDTFELPFAKTGLTADATSEGGPYHESTATFDSVSLRKGKYTVLVPISEEFSKLAPAMYEQYVTSELSKCLQRKMIEQIVNGDGTENNFTGIFCIDDTKNKCVLLADDKNHALDKSFVLDAAIEYGGDEDIEGSNESFLFNKTTLATLSKVIGTTKEPYYEIDAKQKTIDTYPFIISSKVPSATGTNYYAAYGNLASYIVGIFNDIVVERDTSVGFKEGMIYYRASVMAGGVCATPEAINRYKLPA